MKFIAIILSVYFLGLTVTPCSDSAPSGNDHQTEVVSVHSVEHQHSNTDDCTPFCQCHCCHVHTLDVGMIAFEPIAMEISSNLFLHFDSLGEDIPRTLLQPPKTPA